MEINVATAVFKAPFFDGTPKKLDILNPTMKVLVQMIFLFQMGDV